MAATKASDKAYCELAMRLQERLKKWMQSTTRCQSNASMFSDSVTSVSESLHYQVSWEGTIEGTSTYD